MVRKGNEWWHLFSDQESMINVKCTSLTIKGIVLIYDLIDIFGNLFQMCTPVWSFAQHRTDQWAAEYFVNNWLRPWQGTAEAGQQLDKNKSFKLRKIFYPVKTWESNWSNFPWLGLIQSIKGSSMILFAYVPYRYYCEIQFASINCYFLLQ